MSTVFINNTITENHIGCTLAIQSCFYYFNKYKIKISKNIYTNNLQEFHKINYLDYDNYIINGEGTLNNKNKGKGKYLVNIIKILLKHKKKIILLNCSIDLNNKDLKIISKVDLIGVREKKTYEKIKKITSINNVVLTGDLIFNLYIEKKIKMNILKCSKNNNTLFFDTSLISLREKVYIRTRNEKYEFRNLMIKPKFYLCIINPLKFLKYYLFSFIVLLFPYLGKNFRSKFFTYKNQVNSLSNLIKIINNSKNIVTGRFHMTCILIILRKTFIAYEANTFKIESLLNDFGLSNFYEKNILNLNTFDKRYDKKQINQINNYMKYLRKNQSFFYKEIRKKIS